MYAARTPSETYCAAGFRDCTQYNGDLAPQLDNMKAAYTKYAGSQGSWMLDYARGHCKLNNLGAVYSANKVLHCHYCLRP